MALAFGMAFFIFGDIHDEAGDRTDSGVRSGAVSGLVLVFLVIRFPAPAEFETCRLAVPSLLEQGVHLPLLLMALEDEASFGSEHARDDAQGYGLSDEESFPEREQKQGAPTKREDCRQYTGSLTGKTLRFVTLLSGRVESSRWFSAAG